MTSVTVAGGAFDAPKEQVKKAKPASAAAAASPRRSGERWLRYGLGMAIAGLLAADGFVLATFDGAEHLTPARPAAAATPAPTSAPAVNSTPATSGGGFATLDVPGGGATFTSLVTSAATGAAPAASAPASGTTPSLPSFGPSAPAFTAGNAAPGLSNPTTTSDPGPGGGGGGNEGTDPAPSALPDLGAVVAQVPEVGPVAAPVVTEVQTTVEDQVVEPVATSTSAPSSTVTEPVTSGAGSLLP